MKGLVLFCFISLLSITSRAQKNPDSLAYQLQRAKINHMLDLRKEKFGQYSESLSKHTGIFGLQTKKDIRASNDILMDIAKTDENIFSQIKILLDYRTNQQAQVQTHTAEVENYNLGFMNTINKLRQETGQLKQEAQKQQLQQQKTNRNFIIIIVLMLGSILILLFKRRRTKV